MFVPMIVLASISLCLLLFVLSLCRVAARADRRLEYVSGESRRARIARVYTRTRHAASRHIARMYQAK